MATTQIPLTGSTVITTNAAPTMGRFNRYDASGGGLSVPLPALSGQNVGARTSVQKYMGDTSPNAVTFTCAGTDKFDDGTTTTLTMNTTGEQRELQVISVGATKRWKFVGTLSADVPASNEFINVKDFGAVGNGVANDTAAINAAIAVLTPGDTLFFPRGRYMTSGGHVINTAAVTVLGPSGRGGAFWSSAQLYLRPASNADMLTLTSSAGGATVRNLSLQGDKTNQTGASRGVVVATGNHYFLLDAVWVEEFKGDGFSITGNSGTIDNCESRVNDGYGMSLNSSDVVVSGCYIDQNAHSGVFVSPGSVSFNSCHIWGNGTSHTGWYDGMTFDGAVQCQVVNCYIESNEDAGVRCRGGSQGIIVDGCDIWNNKSNGIHNLSVDHCVISNNTIHFNNYNANSGASGAELVTDTCTAMLITGNQLYGGRASYGYYEWSTSNTDIQFVDNMCRAADFVTGATFLGPGTNTGKTARINPRVTSAASASTLTPDISAADMYAYTALAAGLTIDAPIGTPVDGNELDFRIKDNGTSHTLTWNAIFRAIGVTIPTATTANKTVYMHTKYHAADTKWDVIRVSQEV